MRNSEWTRAVRAALGLRMNEKLPTTAILPRWIHNIDGEDYPVGCYPQTDRSLFSGTRRGRKRHRLYVECSCEAFVPAGRMSQHLAGREHRERFAQYAEQVAAANPDALTDAQRQYLDG